MLAGILAVHHAGPMAMGGHDDMGMTTVMQVCLAVVTAVGAAVVAVALGIRRLGRRQTTSSVPRTHVAVRLPCPPTPRARAGPTFLCVFRR